MVISVVSFCFSCAGRANFIGPFKPCCNRQAQAFSVKQLPTLTDCSFAPKVARSHQINKLGTTGPWGARGDCKHLQSTSKQIFAKLKSVKRMQIMCLLRSGCSCWWRRGETSPLLPLLPRWTGESVCNLENFVSIYFNLMQVGRILESIQLRMHLRRSRRACMFGSRRQTVKTAGTPRRHCSGLRCVASRSVLCLVLKHTWDHWAG